nr:tyrosine-type recombinase/integrase [uncultured Pseudomonas sp.]
MTASQDLRNALQGFHLDNPQATWGEIREAIRAFALEALESDHSDDPMQEYGRVYSDLRSELVGHAMTASLTATQSHGLEVATRAVYGAEQRLRGNLRPLNETLREVGDPTDSGLCLPISVNASLRITESTATPYTFRALSDAYLAEHADNVKASTLKALRASLGTVADCLGDTDMATHDRAVMTDLKALLGVDRANSTVNKLLTTMTTVLDWAVNNGLIPRHFAKGLKIKRDVGSDRKAFTTAQVAEIMGNAVQDPTDASTLIQLATITGARLNELATLVKEDIRTVAGVVVLSINEDHDHKSLKNKQSARLIPLVSAHGFDLGVFLAMVEALPEGGRLFSYGINVGRMVNAKLRTFHGQANDKALVFHSLRHSLATAMKIHGVPLDHAQAIMGHATGSITFDLYGKGGGVDLIGLRDSLRLALKG